jgi:hypothetical protein
VFLAILFVVVALQLAAKALGYRRA